MSKRTVNYVDNASSHTGAKEHYTARRKKNANNKLHDGDNGSDNG